MKLAINFRQLVKINIIKILIPIAFLIFGLLIFCASMLFDPDSMPGDLGDARFVNYVLEHGYLWIKQISNHSQFWNLPMFWPQQNTLAASDIMLGGMLLYIPIRALVNDSQTSLQIFFILVNILNFVVFYIFSRKILKLENFYSSIAAYFFTFCLPRYAQTIHLQMFLQFYMVLPIFFLCLINNLNSKIKNFLFFSIASLCFVLLAYTAFYFAWFFVFGLILALFILVLFKNTREILVSYFKNYNFYFLIPVFISLVLLSILACKYLSMDIRFHNLISADFSQLFVSGSYLDYLIFSSKTSFKPDFTVGFGIFTYLFVFIALLKNKYKLQLLFFIFMVLIIFNYQPLYNFFYENLFAFKSIRAVSRYVFLLVPFFAVLIALFFRGIKNRVLFLILFIVFMFEQIPCSNQFQWSKQEHNKRIETLNFPKYCNVVGVLVNENEVDYVVIENIVDILWYASNNRIYAINGYGAKIANANLLNEQCVMLERYIE